MYRERLIPSIPTFIALAALGAGFGMILMPFTLGGAWIAMGLLAISFPVVAWLVVPTLEISNGELSYRHAHIPTRFLDEPRILSADDARQRIGIGAYDTDFVCYSPFISTAVELKNIDPKDRVDAWIVYTRHPQRVASVIQEAHSEQIS